MMSVNDDSGTTVGSNSAKTSATADRGQIDAHECELEPTGRGSGLDEEFKCTICGTVTTPKQGVTRAKRSRKW